MTIEIRRPELEQLIRERMASGAFSDVEDVLLDALRAGEQKPLNWPNTQGRVPRGKF